VTNPLERFERFSRMLVDWVDSEEFRVEPNSQPIFFFCMRLNVNVYKCVMGLMSLGCVLTDEHSVVGN